MNKYNSATQATEIKIYVADMAAYRAGVCHGVWLDPAEPVEILQAQIDKMLAVSPVDSTAIEWAIHDYYGFNPFSLGMPTNLEAIHQRAVLTKKNETLLSALATHFNGNYPAAYEALGEFYQGEYCSVADYAQDYMESNSEISKALAAYVDYEALAADMVKSGNIVVFELGNGIHVFVFD